MTTAASNRICFLHCTVVAVCAMVPPGCHRTHDIDGSADSTIDDFADTGDTQLDIPVPDETERIDAEDTPIDVVDPADPPSDGDADETEAVSCPAGMVYIPGHDLCIDSFEASRPDATATSQGTATGPARSASGVIPWTMVTWYEAGEACRLAGKHLCDSVDWQDVCSHDGDFDYPYGPVYMEDRCWGAESGATEPMPTGTRPCEGGYDNVYDMSGNVAEWLSDCSDTDCGVTYSCYLAEGDYFMACDMFAVDEPDTSVLPLGFRCCLLL